MSILNPLNNYIFMPIPTFQQIMLPLLQFFADGQVHQIYKETEEPLSKIFNLTEDEVLQTYSISNQNKIFLDRIGWARTFLKKAYLLEQVERSKYKITQRGLDLLATKPSQIDTKTLKQYPDFWDKNSKKPKLGIQSQNLQDESLQTPDELIENSYLEIRELLKS
ncbi:MAG: winged helix-turn-helix domain-containing protein, partial [Dolichospermum sp.]